MTKITLTNLVNLQNETTAVNAINANNATLTTALDNTLSRDGTSPNQMNAALDMNNNQIINLPAPSTVNSPARLVDVTLNPTIVVPGTGTSGHTVPFLDGNNTWSGTDTFSSNATFNGTTAFNSNVTFSAATTGVVSSLATTNGVTGGPITSAGTISLDVNGLTTKVAPDQYADMYPVYDVAGALNKKVRIRPPRGHIWGLTLSNDVTNPNTVIDIANGEAASDNATSPLMMVAPVFTKNCNAPWAVGTGNGALDTGILTSSTWYHVYMIMRSDTGVVDYLLSTNATAPTMPTNYDNKRRIGSILTDSSVHILPFKHFSDQFYWTTPVSDFSGIITSTDTAFTLTVPLGVRVLPVVHIFVGSSTDSGAMGFRARSPDLQATMTLGSTDGSPSIIYNVASARIGMPFNELLVTNTSSQINVAAQSDTTTTISAIRTFGWLDSRGRFV